MKTRFTVLLALTGLVALSGCDQAAKMSEKGFRLPDGNADAGRVTFLEMECHQCHTIKGVELPAIDGQMEPYVELGGEVTSVKTYGELVTAIINPSHRLAAGYERSVVAQGKVSKMAVYNEVMTIQQLIDLVMFLQPTYEVVPPKYHYRTYSYPIT